MLNRWYNVSSLNNHPNRKTEHEKIEEKNKKLYFKNLRNYIKEKHKSIKRKTQECKKKSLKVCSCDLHNFLLTNYYRIYDDYHLKLEGEANVK